MPKQIIPSEQWDRFFAEITRQYEGKSATIEALPRNVGPQFVAYDQTFGEIAMDRGSATNTISILLGETFTHTVDAPMRISTWPFAEDPGQVIEIEAVSAPPIRLYLSHSAEQSTGRGEIYGELSQSDPAVTVAGPADVDRRDAERAVGDSSAGAAGGRRRPTSAAISDFEGAGITGAGSEGGRTDSAGRLGGADIGAVGLDVGASRGDADSSGVELGIGLGGVHTVGGGSLGDRDLSGRRHDLDALEDLIDDTDTGAGPGSDFDDIGTLSVSYGTNRSTGGAGTTGHSGGGADIVDPGGDAPVIDTTADPIGGLDDEQDDDVAELEADVGAQAERDLTELFGDRPPES